MPPVLLEHFRGNLDSWDPARTCWAGIIFERKLEALPELGARAPLSAPRGVRLRGQGILANG